MDSIYDDFLDRLNKSGSFYLRQEWMNNACYRMRGNEIANSVEIVVDRQHIQHSNVDWDGYIGSIWRDVRGVRADL